ncbi:MAG TPA: NB-ARC domain-containing protein [Ktedonobacteraceae bacterium]
MEGTDKDSQAQIEQEQSIQQRPPEVLCIYAIPDERFYTDLQKTLILGERARAFSWLETQPGDEISAVLPRLIQRATLILLLLSPDFFASDECYMAMKAALQEQSLRQIPVVPLLARPSSWKSSACKDLKALPDNEQPIDQWTSPELAYENIRAGMARLHAGFATIFLLSPPIRPRLFQVRDLPKSYVPRLHAFAEIKQLLLKGQGKQTAAITTALRGAGGFGKTTLALALCHDAEIQAAFPDGILWIELGEQPPRALDLLNDLLASLEPARGVAITLEEARERWHIALQNRVCLLVIDDVWQAAALAALLEGGPACVRLVTTRNDQVLPDQAERVRVDAMEVHEAVEMLAQGLLVAPAIQLQLESLVQRLGCWPLLISLARGMLQSRLQHGQQFADALGRVEQAYQKRGVMAFHLEHADERQQTVEACLDVSLRHLEEFTSTHYQARERYQELAIFPEDIDIPIATLQIYWQNTGGLESWETEELCMSLHRLSLVLTCDLARGTIRLHDVLRNYLEQCAGTQMSALHARLLNAYWQVCGLRRWADLPPYDTYIWQHLIFHLCHTGREDALRATLTDLGYVTRKALYAGIPFLEADFLLASTFPALSDAEASHSFFASLHRSIVRISHLLRLAHTPAEMGTLLLSHLGWHPAFAAQRNSLEQELPRPFITARYSLPDQSSSALLRTLQGHTEVVNSCAISPDGRFIVSASHDNTLKLWDVETGAERLTLRGHTGSVNGCTVGPDGRFIVSASSDDTLKLWDAKTGVEQLTLRGHTGTVNGCAVSPDGRFIVSASSDDTLKLWDAKTGAERLTLRGHNAVVNSCAVSPDGRYIVSASRDTTLKLWDAKTGVERLTLRGHTGGVYSCAVSPDGHFIVSASWDDTLKVWDVETGIERFTLRGHTSPVNSCAVSPDGRFIVSAAWDNTLKLWDAEAGSEQLTLRDHVDTGKSIKVTSCAVSPAGHFIVSASSDNTLKVRDATTGVERLTLRGHVDIAAWSTEVNGCAVSPDGRFIVSASSDTTLKVWNTRTGAERLTLRGHTNAVTSCAVSPDGRFIVSASSDTTLKVWDAKTGIQRLTLRGHTNVVSGCAVSPDGRFIVSASDDIALKVWDVKTGIERFTLRGHARAGWDTGIISCAVSPDGRFIVSASRDKTLKLWDAGTGAEQLTLRGHTGAVNGCAVSPDGRFILSASSDKTLRLWETGSGRCLLTLPVDGALYGCAWYPDGEHLLACGMHGLYWLRLVG